MASISDVSYPLWVCIGYVLVGNSLFGGQLLYSVVTDIERRMIVNNVGCGRKRSWCILSFLRGIAA